MADFDPADHQPPCRIMTLPDDMLIQAARVAVEIEPRNAPAFQQAASLLRFDTSTILNPQSIAALTTKTWGSKSRTISVSSLDGANAATMNRIVAHMNAWDCGITCRWSWQSVCLTVSIQSAFGAPIAD